MEHLPEGPLLYIVMGMAATIYAIDTGIRWYKALTNRPSDAHAELIIAVRNLISILEHEHVSKMRSIKQIDDLHEWHAPNGDGVQSWKSTSEIARVRGMLHSLINDSNVSFNHMKSVLESIENKLIR